jgi:hypothetical protein
VTAAPPQPRRRAVRFLVALAALLAMLTVGLATAPSAAAASGPPFGFLDAAMPTPDGVLLAGWSIDPDTSAPILVDLYIDGVYTRSIRADRSRPDVASAYPGSGDKHGFAEVLPASEGRRTFCAYGLNVGAGAHALLGCKAVTVSNSPFGSLDVVQRLPGTRNIQVAGWAIDPNSTGGLQIDLYVNGNYAGSVAANRSRPDVAAVYPWAGNDHGFDTSFELWEGVHNVCAYAINVGPGAHSLLGCRSLNFTSTPLGALDTAKTGEGILRLAGWAVDPDVIGPLQVHLYVDDAFVGAVDANVARADIGALFPAYGPAHGFAVDIPVSANAAQVCAYAINQGPGPGYVGLGCSAIAPPLPAGSGSGRRIVYANLSQRLWLVGADGLVERSYPVSGKYLDPPPGNYRVYAFQRYAGAGHDDITMEYFVAFNPAGRGYGFHTIPVYADGTPLQGEDELGFFRSAGCVRQRRADAIYMWNWAKVGDPVVILGS